MPTEPESRTLQVRCPTCHEPCEVAGLDSTREIHCQCCGTCFSLAPEETRSFAFGPEEVIGHFQLLDHLGSGGYGDVWLAQDTILGRQVALKVARADRFTRADADRFFREARAAAQLTHRNIVSVHEVGRDGERMFIVSEFIRGATLGNHISSRRFTARESAELCAAIADGLHHAHESRVIHRDLKPQNIILDLAGIPHITDFGLAKRETGEVTVTVDGSIIGTPSYMSPEQAQGESHKVDRRTDIYSLGVILFYMLTGELPFRGNFRMLLVQIINDPPPAPRRLESKVPRDLETICLKCLEKRREHRYETAAEVADDLRRWLADKPILASPPGVVGRTIRWSRRKPALAAVTAILAVVTLVGGAAFAWQYRIAVRANHELMLSHVEGLRTANPEATRVLLDNIARFGAQALPELRAERARADLSDSQQIRYAIALLPFEPTEAAYLSEMLPHGNVHDVQLICEALSSHAARLAPRLWESVESIETDTATQLRLAAALAAFDPASDRWEAIAGDVVASLTTLGETEARQWLELLSPARSSLLPEFRSLFQNSDNQGNRLLAAHALARFLDNEPEQLVDLLRTCDVQQLPVVVAGLKRGKSEVIEQLEALAQLRTDPDEQAANAICNAAIALARLDRADVLWRLLEDDVAPDVRVPLIHRLAPAGVAPEVLADRLSSPHAPAVGRSLLLALGEYEAFQSTSRFRESIGERVNSMHEQHPDPGIHSAAGWLLRKWRIARELPPLPASENRDWFTDKSGQTLIIVRGPVTFTMGSPRQEASRSPGERQREVQIPYSFAIGAMEVTLRQYARHASSRHDAAVGPDPDCPVNGLKFNEIAAYCRWLSLQEGMTEDEQCFPPVDPQAKEVVVPYDDFLSRPGYRPPTEAEWEYACRAGTRHARFTGSAPDMLAKYAWYAPNSDQHSWPAGSLKPNDFGLFDVYGNLYECVLPDDQVATESDSYQIVIRRGGCCQDRFGDLRSAARVQEYSQSTYGVRGLRVARTMPSR